MKFGAKQKVCYSHLILRLGLNIGLIFFGILPKIGLQNDIVPIKHGKGYMASHFHGRILRDSGSYQVPNCRLPEIVE